jgi:hypothetical protein
MQQLLFTQAQGINILPYDGEALFYPGILTEHESNYYMDQLQKEYAFKQLKIKMYDKEVFHA